MSMTSANDVEPRKVVGKFQAFDRNGDGFIDQLELSLLLKYLNPTRWTDQKLARLFRVLDINSDGRIDYNEFVAWSFGLVSVRTHDLDMFRSAVSQVKISPFDSKTRKSLVRPATSPTMEVSGGRFGASASTGSPPEEEPPPKSIPKQTKCRTNDEYLKVALSNIKELDRVEVMELHYRPCPTHPLSLVERTLQAVHIILEGKIVEDWASVGQMFRDASFIERLLCSEGVGEGAHAALETYIDLECSPSAVGEHSHAARCLCIWVFAMYVSSSFRSAGARFHVVLRNFVQNADSSNTLDAFLGPCSKPYSKKQRKLATLDVVDIHASSTQVLDDMKKAISNHVSLPTTLFLVEFDPEFRDHGQLPLAELFTTSKSQDELEAVTPTYGEAVDCLEQVERKHISEIKGFPKTPALVAMTMEVVMILLGDRPDWETAKRHLSAKWFLSQLASSYDKDNIPPDTLQRVEGYMYNTRYRPDIIGRYSFAAEAICMWTLAVYAYGKSLETPFLTTVSCCFGEAEALKLTFTNMAGNPLAVHDIMNPSATGISSLRKDLLTQLALKRGTVIKFILDERLLDKSEESMSLVELFGLVSK